MLSTRESIDGAGPSDPPEAAVDATGSWAFADADALFLFVHGFSTDATGARDQAYSAALALSASRSGDPPSVVGYDWASDADWDEAKRTADANAAPLAEWLTDWADDDGRPVHLIGYSLGARVACETLRALVERDRPDAVASLSLLGGAIPRTSVTRGGRYGPAIAAVSGPVGNFHSANDRVLGWVYRASDRTRAVGHGGIGDAGDAPAGYADIDVTDLVADHYSYFHPEDGCMPRVVERIEEHAQ
ncbi:alpha/beta fold hydrolase [Halorubrum sp. DTA46]|uniref:alpha/beta fold hydrolase n=1 Tax=Halorubrum sp. DTA46 TaxID=3402162 RepID=UPI003AAC7C69